MQKSLTSLIADDKEWYQMGIFISFILFILIAAGLLPLIPPTPSLFLVMAVFFFCLGEHTNHPRTEFFRDGVLYIRHDRSANKIGYLFLIIGGVLLLTSFYFFARLLA